MEEATIKLELHDKIEHADSNQLKDIYGLITNYFNDQEVEENWPQLSEVQKAEIYKGLEEAEAGLGESFDAVTERLREKHGLNG
jgi:hypothetical protein